MSERLFYRARDLVGTAKTRRAGDRGILLFSPKTLWHMVREGTFPAPVQLSTKVTAWRSSDVDKWVAELPERTAEAARDPQNVARLERLSVYGSTRHTRKRKKR